MRPHWLLFVCLFALASPRTAYGQAEGESAPPEAAEVQERAAARALFLEGVELADQERWDEAADRFQRTYDLQPTPVVAYNLAAALAELGRLVEASEYLRAASADTAADPEVRSAARRMLRDIEPRIGRLIVLVDHLPGGAGVERDGVVLRDTQLNVEVPADPGTHHLQIVQLGRTLDEATVEVPPGGEAQVRLGADLSPEVVAAGAVTSDEPVDTSTDEGGSVAEEWWFWTLIGLVVVGAGVGVGVAIALDGQQSTVDPVPGNLDPPILRGVVMP